MAEGPKRNKLADYPVLSFGSTALPAKRLEWQWNGWPAFHNNLEPIPIRKQKFQGVHHSISITAPPLCDWWRTPIPRLLNRREGPFYAFPIPAAKRNFECGVWIHGCRFDTQYNQAALVLHAGGMDGEMEHWVKCGAEYESGHEYINCVVAAPWCDVSTIPSPLPLSSHTSPPSSTAVWIQLGLQTTVIGRTLSVRFAVKPSLPADLEPPRMEDLVHLRDFPAFGINDKGEMTEGAKSDQWWLGVMVAGLADEVGAQGSFSGMRFRFVDDE
ncbi:hypothetical protein T439DRAFT_361207 [Meredithblackwellia eburnea MCA 4105]